MFIGHFAVGLASTRIAPRASLAPLLAAPLLADLLWPMFLVLGVEQVSVNPPEGNPFLALSFTSYPWSHSLLMSVVWGVLFGGAYYAVTRYGRGAWVVALAVVILPWIGAVQGSELGEAGLFMVPFAAAGALAAIGADLVESWRRRRHARAEDTGTTRSMASE